MIEEKKHATLYRAYRPATFAEVRGQAHIVSVLESAVKNKKPAHAYLFAGGRGTGKTSVARILARELGVNSRDLYEMDAASNRGIDDIRELREGVYALPFSSPYKFYIIDEAHMLTKEAWNALLKTLEEPPAHCIFVLATTELHKVPDTIQSRCEVYQFKSPTREVLATIVIDVAGHEGYTLDRPAAELVALLAEGSFRDSLSILQKVLSYATAKKIDSTLVEEITGAPRGEIVRSIITALSDADAPGALVALQSTIQDNLDARTLAKILMHRLRVVLLLRFAPNLVESIGGELSESDLEMAKICAKKPNITSDTLRIMLECYATMAYATIPHLPLELAIIDICNKRGDK